jgi:hypothetical protein
VLRKAPEKVRVPAAAKHPSIQVAALLSGYPGVQARVYEIWPYLEGLNAQASGPQCGEQCERNCRLAAPAVRSTYQEGVFLSGVAGHYLLSFEKFIYLVRCFQGYPNF